MTTLIEVLPDPVDGVGFRVKVGERWTAPTFNDRGGAAAYMEMIRTGQRRPEYVEGIPGGGGTLIENPNREVMSLIVWRRALRLEAAGMRRRGRSVTAIVKEHFGVTRGTDRVKLGMMIDARLKELGYE